MIDNEIFSLIILSLILWLLSDGCFLTTSKSD